MLSNERFMELRRLAKERVAIAQTHQPILDPALLETYAMCSLAREDALREAVDICNTQHDKARTTTGAARASACADRISKLLGE